MANKTSQQHWSSTMGQSISFFPNQPRVLWRQVWGLAAIQAAITLAWLIYGAYLPKLLTEIGLPVGLELKLLIVESAFGGAMCVKFAFSDS